MTLYLDTSVLLPIFVAEDSSQLVDRFFDANSDTLLVSEFAAAEVGSAISRLRRAGFLNDDSARAALTDFDTWRAGEAMAVDIESVDVRGASLIVRQLDLMLKAPDALHVATARRLDAVLVTLDRRLARAATSLGVTVAAI